MRWKELATFLCVCETDRDRLKEAQFYSIRGGGGGGGGGGVFRKTTDIELERESYFIQSVGEKDSMH